MVEYFSASNKGGALSRTITWVGLEDTVLSETSQQPKTAPCGSASLKYLRSSTSQKRKWSDGCWGPRGGGDEELFSNRCRILVLQDDRGAYIYCTAMSV